MKTESQEIVKRIIGVVEHFERSDYFRVSDHVQRTAWEYSRYAIQINKISKLFDSTVDFQPLAQSKTSGLKRGKRLIKLVANALSYSKVQCIVFDHPRGKIRSPYIIPFIEKINNECIIIREEQDSDPKISQILRALALIMLPSSLNRFGLAWVEFFSFILALPFKRKSCEQLSSSLENCVTSLEGQRLNLSSFIFLRYAIFGLKEIASRHYYRYIGANKVGIISSYAKPYLTQAAKKLGISTFEIQHGVISLIHPGYAGSENLLHFPDTIITWGEFWKNALSTSSTRQILPLGCPELRTKCLKARRIEKKSKMIFLGQINHSQVMERFMYRIASTAAKKGIEVVLKIHPGDDLKRYSPKNHVRISNCDLYEEIGDSKWVIGSGSTAMYEAMASGCHVGIFKDHGYEYMEWMVNKLGQKVIEEHDDLETLLEKSFLLDLKVEDFF